MDIGRLVHSLKQAWQDSPVLVLIIALGVCVTIFIIIDAHRSKKRRSRKRWK